MSSKVMGKKGNWFASVKKALTPDSKRANKLRKACMVKPKICGQVGSSNGTACAPPPQPDPPASDTAVAPFPPPPPPPPPPPLLPREGAKPKLDDMDEEESRQAYSVALATAAAAKAAVAAADAAADVIQLSNASRVSGKLKQEIAAIKIQTAFRGYLSRRGLAALRGLVRLKTLIQRQSVKRQTSSTLRRMQTLARVQSQIRMQRIRMSEENQARQRQVQQKHEKRRPHVGGDWDLSVKSKAEVEAKQQQRQEAARRREKALAYAFTRQQAWRNSQKPSNSSVMDPNNPHWGWGWLERWMEAPRPCSTTECSSEQAAPVKRPISALQNTRKPHPPAKPSAPAPKPSRPRIQSSSRTGKVNTKAKQASTRSHGSKNSDDGNDNNESRSGPVDGNVGSSARDNDSPESATSVPKYMTPTEATAAKSRGSSPKEEDKRAFGTSRKQLSFPPEQSPAEPRRLSGPPKVGLSTETHSDEKKVADGEKRV